MDLRFSQFEILTGTGALFLCLVFVCVFSEASDIEEELGARALEAVRQQDLFWAGVEPQGQAILLTGAAPHYQAKQRAGEIAASVHGVTSVVNEIAIIGEAGTCQQEIDGYLSRERVSFKSGRAELHESSFPILDMLASIARNCGARLEIAGHTDAAGDASVNLKLSQRRADAVRKYLVRSGVSAEQVEARGYGETQPIADNSTADGRKANRRIELRVLGGAA
jgi:outer membrane protein OmpA-like peptidoglycan-associated protein